MMRSGSALAVALSVASVASAMAAMAAGCVSKADPSPPAGSSGGTLTLAPVAWNPANADVGTVAAVVEVDKTFTIFGSKGVLTFTSGAIASADSSIVDWRGAAAIPSPDGLSTWLVGIDGGGRLRRISDSGGPVDVSDRYGVGADKVSGVAAAGTTVTFLLEGGFAVDDGKNVTHYAVAQPRSVAMAKDLVAVADGAGVRVFDHGKESDVALPDAQLVGYDDAGHLLAATSHVLYQVDNGRATMLYDVGGRTIHQLGVAGSGVWLAIDTGLARWSNWQLAFGSGPTIAADARLVPSPSGDVWVMSGGQLQRWSVASAAAPSGDEASWTATVEPIYAAVCSNCHAPPGSGKSSSNIDLSTYEAWTGRRAQIYARVITQAGSPTSMPPPGSGFVLTAAQSSAIAAWSKP